MGGGLGNKNHSPQGPCWGICAECWFTWTWEGSGDGYLSPQGLC